jgi:hypothetical protein
VGFKITKESAESCLIRATSQGDDGPEFLSAAQLALKNLWLHISVDITANPQILGTILPSLLKLQQVISSHQGGIVVSGAPGKILPEILSRLKSSGIRLKDEPLLAPYAMVSPTPAMIPPLGIPLSSVVEAAGQAPSALIDPLLPALPPFAEIEGRFKNLREKVNETLKRRFFLENEKKLYRERIKSLSEGHDDWHLNQEQIHRLHDAEALLTSSKNTRSVLQKELDANLAEQIKSEDVAKKTMTEVTADEKKKREVLDKQLAELNKKQDKIKSDFKKKADTRKERLARVQK